MTITKEHVVEIDYTLKNDAGEVLDSSQGNQPLTYLHGANNIIPGLEKELEGKTTGDELEVSVAPAEGYGERIEEAVQEIPKQALAHLTDLQVGSQLQAETPDGMQVLTVLEMNDENVKVDANHPLAGQNLHFAVKVVSVRKATDEELQHGHAHGPGGHQH